jgi:hypothetical protein
MLNRLLIKQDQKMKLSRNNDVYRLVHDKGKTLLCPCYWRDHI